MKSKVKAVFGVLNYTLLNELTTSTNVKLLSPVCRSHTPHTQLI